MMDEPGSGSVPIYLLECRSWSDGEDDHEEDHNLYYDLNYFYLVDEPDRKIMFTWFAYGGGSMDLGIASEATSKQHLRELSEGEKRVGSVPAERANALVEKEIARLRVRGLHDADARRLADAILKGLGNVIFHDGGLRPPGSASECIRRLPECIRGEQG